LRKKVEKSAGTLYLGLVQEWGKESFLWIGAQVVGGRAKDIRERRGGTALYELRAPQELKKGADLSQREKKDLISKTKIKEMGT